MSDKQNCLIIGLTVRPLAASAKNAGFNVYTIDLFADVDMKLNSVSALKAEFDGVGFESGSLFQCVDQLDPKCKMPVIYGGGFEHNVEQLLALTERRPLWGIQPNTISQLQASKQLFESLGELGFRVPQTRFDCPGTEGNWLQKSIGGSGGLHVEYVQNGGLSSQADNYYQSFINGKIITATLNCYDELTEVVGFSEQWCAPDSCSGEFVYGGAVSIPKADLSKDMVEEIQGAIKKLAIKFKLRGLASLDMIVTEDQWYFLELNPRPSATFELHEGKSSFLFAHYKAFEGQHLPLRSLTLDGKYMAHFVIYAKHEFSVPNKFDWPNWVRDIPESREAFEPGDPVCTVYASARDSERARTLVNIRHQKLSSIIENWN